MRWDTVLMVDWSGGADRGPRPKKDAIWGCVVSPAGAEPPVYLRSRPVAEAWLTTRIAAERAAGWRVLAGFDFPFGYPAGFAAALTGRADALAVWDWLEARIEEGPRTSNRFDVAAGINARFPGVGPFWGNGLRRDIAHLPRKGRARAGHGMEEWRAAERRARGAFSCWQLSGAGSVGSQALTGLPVLARLRRRFGAAAWPFEPVADADVALVEIWPSLLREAIAARRGADEILDAAQVRLMAAALARLKGERLSAMLGVSAPEEGWILGLGFEQELAAAVRAC
ncbi:molybdopterin guanine dinucleotide synthesis [Rhodosalinus sp. FB01]|uniref:molybdopterin guanine dinucleotide synthesis n=1 Tax=Rhodosalinus sp. FB01 TaxID=3239194 RepID=UPI0035257BFB